MNDPCGVKEPLLFLTSRQFERYLGEVSVSYGSEIVANHEGWKRKMSIHFGKWGTPRPRFLARVGSYREFTKFSAFAGRFPADNLDYLTFVCSLMYKDRMNKIYCHAQGEGPHLTKRANKRMEKAGLAHNMFMAIRDFLEGTRTDREASSKGKFYLDVLPPCHQRTELTAANVRYQHFKNPLAW